MDFVDAHPIPDRLATALREALRGDGSGWPGDLGQDEIQALIAHGVAPLVFAATHDPALRDEAVRAAALEPRRTGSLARVLGLLHDGGVQVLLTKGAALAWQVYPAPELRPRGDADLLVAEADLPQVREAMRAAGLVERPSSGDEHGVRQTLFAERDAAGFEQLYDVHWDVTNSPLFASALRFADLAGRAVAVPALGPHARALGLADALLLACIHRVAHHHDSEKLIWLADIALLRQRMTREEHATFWRAAAEARVTGVCIRSIDLAASWFGGGTQHGAGEFLTRDELERDEPSRAFLDREMLYGGVILADLRALAWPDRLERIRQLAFPPERFMRAGGRRGPLAWLHLQRWARSLRRLFVRARSIG